MKPFFPWVGGKRSLLHIILPLIPIEKDENNENVIYIEVFGGGGAVLLAKEPSRYEIYNDYSGDLVNLFQVVKETPIYFLKELNMMKLNSRKDFFYLIDILKGEINQYEEINGQLTIVNIAFEDEELFKEAIKILEEKATNNDANRAVVYYRVLKTSYAASGTSFAGIPIYLDMRKIRNEIFRASDRLKRVVIEQQSYEDLIPRFKDKPNVFFYCDPPYYKTEGYYGGFYHEDHQKLRDILGEIKGKFLLSYNDCEYIRDLYKGFYIIPVERLNNIKQKYDPGSVFKELLIANYDITEISYRQPKQLNIWEEHDEFENY